MTGKKAPKVDGVLRKAFGKAVKDAMERTYPLSPNKPKSLAEDAGVTLSSVQRVIAAEHAPTLDTVEALCVALGIPASSMLRVGEEKNEKQASHLRIDTIKPARPGAKQRSGKITNS